MKNYSLLTYIELLAKLKKKNLRSPQYLNLSEPNIYDPVLKEHARFHYFDGDVTWDSSIQIPDFGNPYHVDIVVVNGSLKVPGKLNFNFYVLKDLVTDVLVHQSLQHVQGTKTVSQIEFLIAEDDGDLRDASKRKLVAPYIFSWFHNLTENSINKDSIVIAYNGLPDQKVPKDSDLTKLLYLQNYESLLILQNKIVSEPEEIGYNNFSFNQDIIIDMVKTNLSLFNIKMTKETKVALIQAQGLIRDRKNKAAVEVLTALTEIEPQSCYVWNLLSIAFTNLKKPAEAKKALANAKKFFPDYINRKLFPDFE